jgi:spoIIIJ-associated protein
MSAYQEFTGKTVEEALRSAVEALGASGLDDLDFEILTPGSRGVLGMGAEPARIVAATRAVLGGAAPRREAAEARPVPPPPHREERDRGRPGRDHDRGRPERGPRRDTGHAEAPPVATGEAGGVDRGTRERVERDGPGERPPRERAERPERGRMERADRGPRREHTRGGASLSDGELAQVAAARASLTVEREEVQAAEASPEALAAAKDILETILGHLGFDVEVTVQTGDTSKLNVTGEGAEKEALGALIGRKGERLSALQHLVNLLLSHRMGEWTRVLVDVEDYRGRRERQLKEIAQRAADRVLETGKMLQLEAMPALERRLVHLALRDRAGVATQSIGEEPNRRVVVIPREG